jgi:antitoxin (DNA-binding transcriptional repressor) of toxin-antitoxin stability system
VHLHQLPKAIGMVKTIGITRRGVPVARLVPEDRGDDDDARTIIDRMKKAREQRSRVSLAEILSARDERRKS